MLLRLLGILCYNSSFFCSEWTASFVIQSLWWSATAQVVFSWRTSRCKKVLQWSAGTSIPVWWFHFYTSDSWKKKTIPYWNWPCVIIEVRLTDWRILRDTEQGHISICAVGSIIIKIRSIVWLPFKQINKQGYLSRSISTYCMNLKKNVTQICPISNGKASMIKTQLLHSLAKQGGNRKQGEGIGWIMSIFGSTLNDHNTNTLPHAQHDGCTLRWTCPPCL